MQAGYPYPAFETAIERPPKSAAWRRHLLVLVNVTRIGFIGHALR